MTGANFIHQKLIKEFVNYIQAQYLGKSPLLLEALESELNREGVLYQKPFIESSPAYVCLENGIQHASIPDWLKAFFNALCHAKLGVYPAPFKHQIDALEAAWRGEDLFVATGTGSGKTECFMWPLMAKLVNEARTNPKTWKIRGVRTIVMYPMNALVSDQVSRLRRLMGDSEQRFASLFREFAQNTVRRPQFGMYTGRTPYSGSEPNKTSDDALIKTLRRVSIGQEKSAFYKKLVAEGRVPAKVCMDEFLEMLKEGKHEPFEDDAELITRFEMQKHCPDILITNYSMLEYMLFRPIEAQIWDDTREWLEASPENKLLFIIDEAHMYRGSAGGEVALLIRRLFNRLNISRDRVQFILTTASMPNHSEEDRSAVMQFAYDLTSQSVERAFCYLTGERDNCGENYKYEIPIEHFESFDASEFEQESSCLEALNRFWNSLTGTPETFNTLDEAYSWLFAHILDYKCFSLLISKCRGTALSLHEIANILFDVDHEVALNAVGVMLAIVPLARSTSGAVLFPARMHMLFRGMEGIFACTNENCPYSHSDGKLTLGNISICGDSLSCKHCGSAVYELYNDRRCGALFFKAYIDNDELQNEFVYLWHYPIYSDEIKMREIHLYISPKGYQPPKTHSKTPISPCYLDVKSGFLYLKDDSQAGKPGIRTLYYTSLSTDKKDTETENSRKMTFLTCPHCNRQLSSMQLTSFKTKGNLAFYNLIKTQFEVQPAVRGKEHDLKRLPNAGRKVLLFSDSRQRAAKLARDMSEASDNAAVRQVFVLAVKELMKSSDNYTLDDIYDFFCIETMKHHLQLFSGKNTKFIEDCEISYKKFERNNKRGKKFKLNFSMGDAAKPVKVYMLRLFCSAYNTLYDAAICWLEPTQEKMYDAIDDLEDEGICVSEEEFLETFNAWILSICDSVLALGNEIEDDHRYEVRPCYKGYGLESNWSFDQVISSVKKWKKDSREAEIWKRVLRETFLTKSATTEKYYVKLASIKPCCDSNHSWFKCYKCSGFTPYLLNGHCPRCGCENIGPLTETDGKALEFWRKPIEDAIDGKPIQVIDTEEHTAQLSHKDQRNELWSVTEKYELRFQDLIQDNESPVDILSSTTTMEVGIDIGSLVAVGLRNIPPMRENYQQRAGRAGRRGTSLSTIVTFCENGPHDTLYFQHPEPMFRGEPRRPWIDIRSIKLHYRHLVMIIVNSFLADHKTSIDSITACEFIDTQLDCFIDTVKNIKLENIDLKSSEFISEDKKTDFVNWIEKSLNDLRKKRDTHPELYGEENKKAKTLLDAFYEEGIIPTYSFPKNVVSMNISENDVLKYQIERGLDIAISEYAPGRSIVVDKKTYQIGGFYYPGSDRKKGKSAKAAREFIEDRNYLKPIKMCSKCHWFGLASECTKSCPFCENTTLHNSFPMLIPWGFAPRNGTDIQEAQLKEQTSYLGTPLYSTVPTAEDMDSVPNCKHIRMANRKNQRIIAMNKGIFHEGFDVCKDCGAAFPHAGTESLKSKKIKRPYKSKYINFDCSHSEIEQVHIGYDFLTDMLVLEIALDRAVISVDENNNLWLERAAQSLAEAIRLAVSKKLDIEFSELETGFRVRRYRQNHWVDIYIYDSLSSGAGYAVSLDNQINELLKYVNNMLQDCRSHCESACYDCLKHYRNQPLHGMLDRNAALQLLHWGQFGELPKDICLEDQINLIKNIENILTYSGGSLKCEENGIFFSRSGITKRIIVYPSMKCEPEEDGVIAVQDAELKYAKQIAVKKILEALRY